MRHERVPKPKGRAARRVRAPRQTLFRLGKRDVNRYDLYEMAVQSPALEAAFLRAVHGGEPRVLGEDFCGPASVARAWCASDPEATAVGVDLDEEPLEHARARVEEHDLSHEPPIGKRLTLRCRDVLEARDKADVIAALNFAACELHQRRWLVSYLRAALSRLKTGGVIVCDLYAGAGAWTLGVTEKPVPTESGVVRYLWEQRAADPFDARVTNAIHFVLPGRGSEKSRTYSDAFVYDWRLWSAPELRDAMREAGFAQTEVYTSYGDAVDEAGNLYVSAAATDDEAMHPDDIAELAESDDCVVYVVGRVNRREG